MISAEKRHRKNEKIFPLQASDDFKTMCPYCAIKPELCVAALASSMIHKQECFSTGYHDCAIFLVNKRKVGEEQICPPAERICAG